MFLNLQSAKESSGDLTEMNILVQLDLQCALKFCTHNKFTGDINNVIIHIAVWVERFSVSKWFYRYCMETPPKPQILL